LQKTTFPSGLIETYTFDELDNLTAKTDRLAKTISYTYDYQNRLAKKQYPSGTPVNYTYDSAGRLTQVTDGTGTCSFAYDNMGRLTSGTTNYSFTTFGNETVQYVYDAASNRTRMIDPQHLETFYTYDALNRLSNLSGVGGTNFGFSGACPEYSWACGPPKAMKPCCRALPT
jgi:YD repeat-containing protein